MKKLFVFALCLSATFVLHKMSVAQSDSPPGYAQTQPQLPAGEVYAPVLANAPAPTQALPFGYPPYPTTVEGHPPYGYPYSYPRLQRSTPRAERPQRPLFARLAPPPAQPYPLPQPGAAPAPVPPPPPAPSLGAAPFMTTGIPPQQQGMIVAVPPAPAPPGPPVVVHRPAPFKNFRTLMFSPRPYIGYDPYAGYPPYPGYMPPQ